MTTTDARINEYSMLSLCQAAAVNPSMEASSGMEANMFRVASCALGSRFPIQARRLLQASRRYFVQHPLEQVASQDVVRQGWVRSLPSFQCALTRALLKSGDCKR